MPLTVAVPRLGAVGILDDGYIVAIPLAVVVPRFVAVGVFISGSIIAMQSAVTVPRLGAVCPFDGWSIRTMTLVKYMELEAVLDFYMFNGQPVSEHREEDGKGEVESARVIPDEPV